MSGSCYYDPATGTPICPPGDSSGSSGGSSSSGNSSSSGSSSSGSGSSSSGGSSPPSSGSSSSSSSPDTGTGSGSPPPDSEYSSGGEARGPSSHPASTSVVWENSILADEWRRREVDWSKGPLRELTIMYTDALLGGRRDFILKKGGSRGGRKSFATIYTPSGAHGKVPYVIVPKIKVGVPRRKPSVYVDRWAKPTEGPMVTQRMDPYSASVLEWGGAPDYPSRRSLWSKAKWVGKELSSIMVAAADVPSKVVAGAGKGASWLIDQYSHNKYVKAGLKAGVGFASGAAYGFAALFSPSAWKATGEMILHPRLAVKTVEKSWGDPYEMGFLAGTVLGPSVVARGVARARYVPKEKINVWEGPQSTLRVPVDTPPEFIKATFYDEKALEAAWKATQGDPGLVYSYKPSKELGGPTTVWHATGAKLPGKLVVLEGASPTPGLYVAPVPYKPFAVSGAVKIPLLDRVKLFLRGIRIDGEPQFIKLRVEDVEIPERGYGKASANAGWKGRIMKGVTDPEAFLEYQGYMRAREGSPVAVVSPEVTAKLPWRGELEVEAVVPKGAGFRESVKSFITRRFTKVKVPEYKVKGLRIEEFSSTEEASEYARVLSEEGYVVVQKDNKVAWWKESGYTGSKEVRVRIREYKPASDVADLADFDLDVAKNRGRRGAWVTREAPLIDRALEEIPGTLERLGRASSQIDSRRGNGPLRGTLWRLDGLIRMPRRYQGGRGGRSARELLEDIDIRRRGTNGSSNRGRSSGTRGRDGRGNNDRSRTRVPTTPEDRPRPRPRHRRPRDRTPAPRGTPNYTRESKPLILLGDDDKDRRTRSPRLRWNYSEILYPAWNPLVLFGVEDKGRKKRRKKKHRKKRGKRIHRRGSR